MAKAYFLNAQDQAISIELNSDNGHVLQELDPLSPNPDSICTLGLQASKNRDVLGTGNVNQLTVRATNSANAINWTIEMDEILPDRDIQFLVFEDRLLARQASTVKGFTITQAT